ncbi:MAG TPA: GNAT family protein [Terriglobales bacterium]|nr:GNAT family protein [Terriglobales bacterium]
MSYQEYQELRGERSVLLPLQMDHAEGLWEAGSAPEIWTYMRAGVNSLDEMKAWIAAALEERDKTGSMPYAIADRSSGKLLGSTRVFDIQPAFRNGEIGHTWYSTSVWRTAVNTECKLVLMGHCFEELDYVRVQFKTDLRNERSQKAIERLGAVKEGALRDHMILPNGYVRTSVYYSVVAREWPQVKQRLQGFLAKA